jgi:hypothetical protein
VSILSHVSCLTLVVVITFPAQSSEINRLGKRYRVDAFLALADVGQIVPDAPMEFPTIMWLPYHFPEVKSNQCADFASFVLALYLLLWFFFLANT